MKIIAIEGLDKAGKKTQTDLLAASLKELGYKVMQSEFHRYDTFTGELIQHWLQKRWDVDQLTIEFIMAADKQAQQRWFQELENDGYDFLILDRYVASQTVYAYCNGIDPNLIIYLQLNLRKPDLTFLINISAEESMKRKGKYGDNDRYESDLELLNKVRERYIDEVIGTIWGRLVNGDSSIEKIASQILQTTKEKISDWQK